MVTPQTNTTLDEIAERLSALDDFAICGHVNPDGDCLGSQLGLYHALKNLGKKVVCLLAKDDPIDTGLLFLPGVETLIPAAQYSSSAKVFVAVDVPTTERIGEAAAIQAAAKVRFTIDHHAVDTTMAEFTYVDPAAPAASLLVWNLAKKLNAISFEVAQCCLTGLITDTGRFAYQNTNAEAFFCAAEMVEAGASPAVVNREFFQNRSLASVKLEQLVLERMEFYEQGAFVVSYLSKEDFATCNAIKADAEPLIDSLRSIRGVRVALILRENSEGQIRGSLRAKDDDTDVAAVARFFDGGGHKAAAGFTFYGSMDEALSATKLQVISQCFSDDNNRQGVALNG